jgi:hypothetical protein
MLRDDVVEAVREGRFHVHAVASIAEGMALLAGRPMGERQPDGRYPDDTINARIERRLELFTERMKGSAGDAGAVAAADRDDDDA